MSKKSPRLVKETCIAGWVIDQTVKLIRGMIDGQERRKRTNPTSEKVEQNNDRIAILNLSRLVNANFGRGDGHLILTYAMPPTHEDHKKNLAQFTRRLRDKCRKKGIEFKAVWATELQSRIHVHMIIQRVDILDIQDCWTWGRIKWIPLDDEGDNDYSRLAEYIIKETNENFRKSGNQTKQRYSRTRNLDNPIIVRQEASPKDFNINNIKPVKGYKIDEDSIVTYENPITGCPTLFYKMIAIDEENVRTKWRGRNAKPVRREPFATFTELRQTEFSDLCEWWAM